ncbi:hypothetical protein ABK040_014990 [Willaertia magna]
MIRQQGKVTNNNKEDNNKRINNNREDEEEAEDFMQNLMSSIKQLPNNNDNNNNPKQRNKQQQQGTTNIDLSEMDLKTVDLLTQKLAKDLSTKNFLDDDDFDEEDDDNELSDDEDFKNQLLAEFKNLNLLTASKDNNQNSNIPKSKLKTIYLSLLRSGQDLITDKNQADEFLSKLLPNELAALMELLQKDPEETIQYFNNDPQIIEAVKNTPMLGNKIWENLTEQDLDELEEDDEEEEGGVSKRKERNVSEAVKEALKIFEENLIHYTQNPQQLMLLCEKLSDKDQTVFLDILFRDYTPEKMTRKIKKKGEASVNGGNGGNDKAEQIDDDLVAHVFREVLTHFKAYKKYPEKFKPLIDRLNEREKKMFESLVKTFWDVNLEIKKK